MRKMKSERSGQAKRWQLIMLAQLGRASKMPHRGKASGSGTLQIGFMVAHWIALFLRGGRMIQTFSLQAHTKKWECMMMPFIAENE